jgi:hypothetical protein
MSPDSNHETLNVDEAVESPGLSDQSEDAPPPRAARKRWPTVTVLGSIALLVALLVYAAQHERYVPTLRRGPDSQTYSAKAVLPKTDDNARDAVEPQPDDEATLRVEEAKTLTVGRGGAQAKSKRQRRKPTTTTTTTTTANTTAAIPSADAQAQSATATRPRVRLIDDRMPNIRVIDTDEPRVSIVE